MLQVFPMLWFALTPDLSGKAFQVKSVVGKMHLFQIAFLNVEIELNS